MLSRRFVLVLTLGLAGPLGASAQDKSMTVASTTSTQDSGLFEHILPLFKAKTGMDVKVVAQGTAAGSRRAAVAGDVFRRCAATPAYRA